MLLLPLIIEHTIGEEEEGPSGSDTLICLPQTSTTLFSPVPAADERSPLCGHNYESLAASDALPLLHASRNVD